MDKLEQDIVALMKKRVYDIAGIFGGKMKVSLNGNVIKINSFLKYVDLYLPNNEETIKIYDKDMTTPRFFLFLMRIFRWEVLATYSATQF
jgi:DNA topoisomerase-2